MLAARHGRLPHSPDLRDLNATSKFVHEEAIPACHHWRLQLPQYRLDVEGMKTLLRKLTFIRALERGEYVQPEE